MTFITRSLVWAGAVAMGTAACVPDVPAGANDAITRAAIISEINKGVHATISKDVDGYLAQIPDVVGVHDSAGSLLSRTTMRQQVIEAWKQIDTTRALDVLVDTIIARGDSATVLTTTRWDRLIFRAEHKTIDTVLSVIKHRELWRKTPSGWRAFDVITLGKTTNVNGKPYQGS
jgi:hypothetical protein